MLEFAVTGVYSSNKSAFLIFSEVMANLIPFIILLSHITKKTLTPTNTKKLNPFIANL